jgi:hypothetical protein
MEQLVGRLLSQKWIAFMTDRPSIEKGEYPGVYLLAFGQKYLQGKDIDLSDVFYVGMSNARGGLNQRLRQFADAIEARNGKHSAGTRFLKKWCNGTPYSKLALRERFYVTAITIPCQVKKKKREPENLRTMGDVAALEYYVLAKVKEASNREPQLNKK